MKAESSTEKKEVYAIACSSLEVDEQKLLTFKTLAEVHTWISTMLDEGAHYIMMSDYKSFYSERDRWSYTPLNFKLEQLGFIYSPPEELTPEEQVFFANRLKPMRLRLRPLRPDAFNPEGRLLPYYRSSPIFNRLFMSSTSIDDGVEILLEMLASREKSLLEALNATPSKIVMQMPDDYFFPADNPPHTVNDPNFGDRLESRPVLGIMTDGRPRVLVYWKSKDPNDAQQFGWRTDCSETWDVTGQVKCWRHIKLPK